MRKRLFGSAIVVLVLGSVATPAVAKHGRDDDGRAKRVRLEDRCDPASFNAAIPSPPGQPPTCIPHRDGRNITFDEFVAKLNPDDFGHSKWRNNSDDLDLDYGDSISAVVRGGEFHTFTEVERYGPGCLAFINDALGLTGPAPTEAECFGPGGFTETSGVLPNGLSTLSVGPDILTPGVHKFMCELHPWMKTTVTVEHD